MRKEYLQRIVRVQTKREKKRLKRLRKNRYYKSFFTQDKVIEFRKKVDKAKIDKFNFSLNVFLNGIDLNCQGECTTQIEIVKDFSLENNYFETLNIISTIRQSLLVYLGHKFVIDFTKCEHADFSALFLLKVILDEYISEFKKLEKSLLIFKSNPEIQIRHSKFEKVNLSLLANSLIVSLGSPTTDFIPISIHNLIIGRRQQKHYLENKKGLAVTSLREYINNGLKRYGFELNAQGRGYFDGLISEILNNAEDHSCFDKWYAFANLYETRTSLSDINRVGEINFAFLNFGYSIFDGFENSKIDNSTIYNEMEELTNIIQSKKGGSRFTKENLFTLYALQDGNSRLKYIKESRGTGTMKFIKSFLSLGDYQDDSKGFRPRMLIFSGNTVLICDNMYQPFEIDGVNYLSLNRDNDMTLPPEESHLITLKSKFPGTLITGTIYLNNKNLISKMNNGN